MPKKQGGRNAKGLNKKEKKQVLAIVNRGRENKYHDTLLSVTEEYGGSVYSISDVPQGDTDITRDGDQFVQRALRIRGKVVVADSHNLLRMLVFRWKQDDTPTVSDLLSSTYVGSVRAPYSPYHHDGRTNFTVLFDKTYLTDSYKTAVQIDTKWINLRNKKQYMTAGSSTAGKNKIYVMIISDSAAEPSPLCDIVSRLTFTDS